MRSSEGGRRGSWGNLAVALVGLSLTCWWQRRLLYGGREDIHDTDFSSAQAAEMNGLGFQSVFILTNDILYESSWTSSTVAVSYDSLCCNLYPWTT